MAWTDFLMTKYLIIIIIFSLPYLIFFSRGKGFDYLCKYKNIPGQMTFRRGVKNKHKIYTYIKRKIIDTDTNIKLLVQNY